MDVICPKGHHSTDPDYCSECGAKVDGASATIPGASAADAASAPGDLTVCPDCGTKRDNLTAAYCEICRFNFAAQQGSNAPQAGDWPPMGAAAPALDSVFSGWDAIVSVDAGLYTEPDPNFPLPEDIARTFPLDLADNLIGRRSERRDIHPEIDVTDPGVSHRHAKLFREPDGTLSLLDVGSTNGTQLNGVDVARGVRTPVTDGDQVTLGSWTRIVIRGRRR